MTLADQIIEHGPYAQDYLIGPGFAGPLRWLRAAELNELRDELIAARTARERQQRFQVEAGAIGEDGQLWLTCDRCGHLVVVSDEPLTLAELNQHADEHTEECR
jgi:hypothetical protein